MPKAGSQYGPKQFKTETEAYLQYERDRIAETPNPALARRKEFAQIWKWRKKKRTPGRQARVTLEKQ